MCVWIYFYMKNKKGQKWFWVWIFGFFSAWCVVLPLKSRWFLFVQSCHNWAQYTHTHTSSRAHIYDVKTTKTRRNVHTKWMWVCMRILRYTERAGSPEFMYICVFLLYTTIMWNVSRAQITPYQWLHLLLFIFYLFYLFYVQLELRILNGWGVSSGLYGLLISGIL